MQSLDLSQVVLSRNIPQRLGSAEALRRVQVSGLRQLTADRAYKVFRKDGSANWRVDS